MKRIALLIILASAIGCMTATAQTVPPDSTAADSTQVAKKENRVVEITTNFNIGGDAIMLTRGAGVSLRDFKPLRWELTNETFGDKNFITLKVVNSRTGNTEAVKSWKDGIHLKINVNEKGEQTFTVYDDTFVHLIIVENQKGTAILLFSVLRKK